MHKHKNWVDYTSDKVQGGLVVLDVMAFPSIDTSKEKEASKSGVVSTMSNSPISTLLVLGKWCLRFLVHLGKNKIFRNHKSNLSKCMHYLSVKFKPFCTLCLIYHTDYTNQWLKWELINLVLICKWNQHYIIWFTCNHQKLFAHFSQHSTPLKTLKLHV